MSNGLFMFLILYVVVIGLTTGLLVHVLWVAPMNNNGIYVCFWKELWDIDFLENINKFGKIVVEIVYTIAFAPFLILYHFLISIIMLFAHIFRKGGND